jgi:hypothetical protein
MSDSPSVGTRYLLTLDATHRVLGPDRVEVTLGTARHELTLPEFRVLLEFAQPRTREEAYHACAAVIAQPAVYRLVMRLEEAGLLRPQPHVPAAGQAEPDFAALFNPGLLDSDERIAEVGAQLDRGRCIVIPNAFRPELAERVHRDLDEHKSWTLYEDVLPYFHSQHHSIYYEKLFPPSVLECKAALNSASARRFMSRLSHRDCSGELDLGASWYMPGDHSLPHRDAGLNHSVAFVWYVTREWRDEWGGSFYWCPSGATVVPRFNTLVLFDVSPASMHFVTLVSPYATAKRLALYGWWTRAATVPKPLPPTQRLHTEVVFPSEYGEAPEKIGAGGIIAV